MYLVEEYGFHVAFETVQKSPPVRAGFLDSRHPWSRAG